MSKHQPVTEQIVIPHNAFAEALYRVEQSFSFANSKTEAEGLAIVGESGTGKTSVMHQFRGLHKPERRADGMHIPILFASVPSSPTVKSLAGVILEALQSDDQKWGTENQRSRQIRILMRECGTRMVMIDEFQHFYDRGKHRIMHHVADWLKILIDETRTSLVVAGLPTCLAVIDQNEQLARRFSSPVRLGRFDWQSENERAQFVEVLRVFHGELQTRYDLPTFTSDQMAFRFWAATGGLMGYLSKMLRQLERNAISKNSKVITLGDLHVAHSESIWAAQRIPDLPEPFSKSFMPEPNVGLYQTVRRIGVTIDLPEPVRRQRSVKPRRESIHSVLTAR